MSRQPKTADLIWALPRRGDRYLDIRISRNTLIAALISIIVHAILLFCFFPRTPLMQPEGTVVPTDDIVVQLGPPPAKQAAAPPPTELPIEAPTPKPKKQTKTPTPKTPPIMAVEKPQLKTRPIPPVQPPTPDVAAPTDMMSYVNAARARRQSQENSAVAENAAAVSKEQGPSEEDKRDAIIKRNLQGRDGNGGMFTILSKNSRSATISFNGWKGDYSIAKRETYQIEPGPDGNINLAIIRRVITRIRQDNPGDFPWESQRLGRTVTMSARIEDNAGLEEFLMEEFFGPRGRSFNP